MSNAKSFAIGAAIVAVSFYVSFASFSALAGAPTNTDQDYTSKALSARLIEELDKSVRWQAAAQSYQDQIVQLKAENDKLKADAIKAAAGTLKTDSPKE